MVVEEEGAGEAHVLSSEAGCKPLEVHTRCGWGRCSEIKTYTYAHIRAVCEEHSFVLGWGGDTRYTEKKPLCSFVSPSCSYHFCFSWVL